MSKEIFINLEREAFLGNVLDVGFDNHGIVYEICKNVDDDIVVDYVGGDDEKERIEECFYHSCVIFFSLSNILNKKLKSKFIQEIATFLKADGILYLWDVDKPRFKISKVKLKVVVSKNKIKDITVKILNPLIDSACETICKLLEPYFNIVDLKRTDKIYFIKAQKRGVLRESITNSSKC